MIGNDWLSALLLMVIALGVTITVVRLVRRRVPAGRLRGHNDVAAAVHATVGVIYGVILAFVVIVVWEKFSDAEQYVSSEAAELETSYRISRAFPDSVQQKIRQALAGYLEAVVREEWPAMTEEQSITPHPGHYSALWSAVQSVGITSLHDEIWLSSLTRSLERINDARMQRLNSAHRTVTGTVWALLILGGLITIVFALLYDVPHAGAHTMMATALAAMIALALSLIAMIDQPFTGALRISPEEFEGLVQRLRGMP